MQIKVIKSKIKTIIHRLTYSYEFLSLYDIPEEKCERIRVIDGFSVYNLNGQQQFTYQDKEILFFKNVHFFANNGYVVIDKNKLVVETGLFNTMLYRHNQGKINLKSLKELKLTNACSLADHPYGVFYHLIIDTLPRIYGISYIPVKEVHVVIPDNVPLHFKKLIESILPSNCIPIWVNTLENVLVTVDNYYHLPHYTENAKGYLPPAVLNQYKKTIFNTLNISEKSTKNNLIYISRAKAPKRKFKNESKILDYLIPRGFKCVFLEDLSFTEQIELFRDAKVIIGIHGAGFANLIWSERATVLEIFPSTNQNAWQFETLALAVNANYNKIILEHSNLNTEFEVSDKLITQIDQLLRLCAE